MKEFNRQQFLEFLIKAKKNGYASQGDNTSVEPLIPGTKQLEYKEGDYLYRDVYVGMNYFVGQEIIYFQNEPIYSMCFAGGVEKSVKNDSDVLEIYRFLRSALIQVSKEYPFRGPDRHQDQIYEYFNKSDGSIESFSGKEHIILNGQEVYHLFYNGGLIK